MEGKISNEKKEKRHGRYKEIGEGRRSWENKWQVFAGSFQVGRIISATILHIHILYNINTKEEICMDFLYKLYISSKYEMS